MSAPPFGPAVESVLLQPLPLPAVPGSFPFDSSQFLSVGLPARAAVDSSKYSGLALQLKRALAGLDKSAKQRGDSPDATRQSVQMAQDVCVELLESVRIMKETRMQEQEQYSRGTGSRASHSRTSTIAGSSSGITALSDDTYDSDLTALSSLESHLVSSLRSLRSLLLLLRVLNAMPAVVSERDVRAMQTVTEAVSDLQRALEQYRESSVMAAVRVACEARVLSVLQYLLQFVHSALPAHTPESEDEEVEALAAAFAIIDRQCEWPIHAALCQWFAQCRVAPFEQRVRDGLIFSTVAQLSDAYKWCYSENSDFLMNNYNKIFPAHWHADAFVVKRFVDVCLQQLTTKLVDEQERGERMDLFAPLSTTKEFDQWLATDVPVPLDPTTGAPLFALTGVLPECFTQYTPHFIEAEHAKMSKTVEKSLIEEKWAVEDSALDSPTFHFTGAEKLLRTIEQSVDRLRPLLPDEKMYSLFVQHKRAVGEYLKRTDERMPNAPTAGAGAGNGGRADMNAIIAIVRSAEWLAAQLPRLSDRVKMTDADYVGQLTFRDIDERVSKLRNKAAMLLVQQIQARLEPQLTGAIKDAKKDLHAHVGDESLYMRAITATIRKDLRRLERLPNYSQLLSAFLTKFLPSYSAAIKNLKGVSDVFAEQLVTDTERLRRCLLTLPGVCTDPQAVLAQPFPPPIDLRIDKKSKRDRDRRDAEEKKIAADTKSPSNAAVAVTSTVVTAESSAAANGSENGSVTESSSATDASGSAPPSQTQENLAPASAILARVGEAEGKTVEPPQPLQPPPIPTAPPAPEPLLHLIDSHLVPLVRQLLVMAAPQAKLIAVFRAHWPKRHSALLLELMEQKGMTSSQQEKLVKQWNTTLADKSSKRVEWEQKTTMAQFFGDIKKTFNTMQ